MNQRFFAEFLALLAKKAMEQPESNHEDKKSVLDPGRDGEDPQDYGIEENLAAEDRKTSEARDERSNSITIFAPIDPYHVPFRSPSGRHLSVSGRLERVT
jgi:hypothetical protein